MHPVFFYHPKPAEDYTREGMNDKAYCHREKIFLLFIALCWKQNPIGGCCSQLNISEFAREIFSRL